MSAWLIIFCSAVSAEEIENLAKGGDFEEAGDKDQWDIWLAAGTKASMKIDKKNAAIGDSSLLVYDIILDPVDKWKPLIAQPQLILEEDTRYTLSAFLKAEKNRDVRMHFIGDKQPWPMSPDKTVPVTTEWEEYWTTGIPPQSVGRILFCNAPQGSKVSYWIDGVRFYIGEYQPAIPDKAIEATGKLAITWATIKTKFDR